LNFPILWNDCALGLLLIEFNLGRIVDEKSSDSKKLFVSTGSDAEKIIFLL